MNNTGRDKPGIGDDIPCSRCGVVALDTGLECSECGYDMWPELNNGRDFPK